LYLGSRPHSAGAYAYNRMMLEAAASFPRDEFETVVAFSHEGWRKHVEGYGLPAVRFPLDACTKAAAFGWHFAGLPDTPWHRAAPRISPFVGRFVRMECDLWIFASPGTWMYRIPVPAVGVIHDLMHRYEKRFQEAAGGWRRRFRETLYSYMCRHARVVLVDSEVGKNHVHESYGLDPGRIAVLPFTPPEYIYSGDVPGDFDSRYGLPEKYFLYPSRFWDHKNHKALVRAAARIIGDVPDLMLVFAGLESDGYDSLRRFIVETGLEKQVVFTGYVPEEYMPEMYRRARAMIMPTFFGPTNIPPLEAFVAGCPVAVSNVYGMPEQVGDAALLFDPESDDEIARVMLRLWRDDDLCEELAARGKERVKRFEQEHFNRRLLDVVRREMR